jgi:hypothetical protein
MCLSFTNYIFVYILIQSSEKCILTLSLLQPKHYLAMCDFACRDTTYLRFHSSAAVFVIILAQFLYCSLKQPP